jgi:DNA-binding NtrC family response regulator
VSGSSTASGKSVLIVDDDVLVTEALGDLLQARGYATRVATSVASAKRALDESDCDAILLDLYLPDGDGMDLLHRALERAPAPQVMLMTARADVRGAVEAMRHGAADYIEKPFDVADLTMRLERALDTAALKRKLALYEERDRTATSAVIASETLRDIFAVAARLAATPSSSALILGESGVGKEVLAAHVHESSDRSRAPFVKVNLAAIPESMVEAELFGSVRGAFTDAKRDRAGHFASAEGGTLLLDELCEFKVELQPKLLRVLEERRFFPVGSDRERRMNVRVLAATNRDPQAAIASGRLRQDLYYRLATVTLRVPPLRERREDIVPLATHFLARFAAEFGRSKTTFSAEAKEALTAYDWPGNARELRNVVERATMLAESQVIGPVDLDLPPAPPSSPPSYPTRQLASLGESEREHIEHVLVAMGGSRTRTAAALGISRSTLWDKLKRYGLAR